ncbi:unnamed protein product [Echinostoma caproni]|uniref:Protein kinase domain-containing protein n=1 Tax=Echinostoma caproni TaxID=27848 RepID=A0A183AW71_9TREM|nr:unnamed protein product [Echinostoma caproni]
MDRFLGDLESVLKQGRLSAAGAALVASNVLDALEYMHSKDYAHADIKASNLLHGNKVEEVYLVDFGLVHLFRISGVHCSAKPDPKYRHNGTLEFCSLDSHQDPKLRDNVPESVKNQVAAIKEKSVKDLGTLTAETGFRDHPDLVQFATEILQLRYDESPNYASLKRCLADLHKSLRSGVSRTSTLVTKRPSTDRSVIALGSTEDIAKQTIGKDVPVKRPRGRAAASKPSTKKSATAAPAPADSSPTPPVSRPAARGAGRSK